MGLKRREIMGLFLTEGILIGLLGAIAGFFLGGLVVSVVGRYGIDFSASASMGEMMALLGDKLYPQLSVDLLIQRSLTVAAIAMLASLYPAWQASKREPAEALHFV